MNFRKIIEPFLVLTGKLHCCLISQKFSYAPNKKIQQFQFKKLRRLLIESYQEIPYYRQKFDYLKFDPGKDFKSIGDLSKIPILSKEDARLHHANLISKKHKYFALEFKTSGSTGNPFQAWVSPVHWIIEQSCIWRHWSWAGYRFRDKMAIVRSYVPKNENDLIKWDKLRNFLYFSPFHLTDKNICFYLERMIQENVIFLRGYPSSILAIADYVKRHPHVSVPNFKAIFTASEYLGDLQRAFIEHYLKARIFNHYGLAEQVIMFGSCEFGTHLHHYEEYGHLELLDTDHPNIKRIIGTNLHNVAMPLIRYDTGDLAVIDPENKKCQCGRTSAVIQNVIGRKDATVNLDDGSIIPVTNFYTMFEHYGDYFTSWQIIQEKAGILRIVVDAYDTTDTEVLRKKLTTDIEKRTGNRCLLKFNFNSEFILVGEGKKNPFIKVNT